MLLIVGGLLGLLWAGGNSEVRKFENRAAKEIRTQLQGDRAEVRVRTRAAGVSGELASATITAKHFSTPGLPLFVEPDRSTRGVLHELRLDLRDFRLKGLRVERLRATIPDCRFDYALAWRHQQIRLSRSGTGRGEVEILLADLAPFITGKFREIKRVTVATNGDRVRVDGFGEFLIFNAEFSVDAALSSPDGRTLALTDARILFDGRPADPIAAQTLLRTLNPVVDLAKDLGLADAMKVETIVVHGDRLRATGATKIPLRPVEPGG